jgi:hypothetical protein
MKPTAPVFTFQTTYSFYGNFRHDFAPELRLTSRSFFRQTVRQELKRFERKGLGYSKSLEMHKLAVALHFGVYNYNARQWPLD